LASALQPKSVAGAFLHKVVRTQAAEASGIGDFEAFPSLHLGTMTPSALEVFRFGCMRASASFSGHRGQVHEPVTAGVPMADPQHLSVRKLQLEAAIRVRLICMPS
jgi:hypothetical protein